MNDPQLVELFKALANPYRLDIFLRALSYLPAEGTVVEDQDKALSCQREIASELGIAPSTLSHHFKELKNAGLINIERNGQQVAWSLNQTGMSKLKVFAEQLAQNQNGQSGRG